MSTRRVYAQKKMEIDSEETKFRVNNVDEFTVNGLKILHEGSNTGSSASYGSMDMIYQGSFVANDYQQIALEWENAQGSSITITSPTQFTIQPGIYTLNIMLQYSPYVSPNGGYVQINNLQIFGNDVKREIMPKPTGGETSIQVYSFHLNVTAVRTGCTIVTQLFSGDGSVLIQSGKVTYIKHA